MTYLGSYAFYDLPELTEVYLPATLEEIGYGTFSECYALKKAVYADYKPAWLKVVIDDENECLPAPEVKWNAYLVPHDPSAAYPNGVLKTVDGESRFYYDDFYLALAEARQYPLTREDVMDENHDLLDDIATDRVVLLTNLSGDIGIAGKEGECDSYTAFGAPNGGLFVAWQQNADTADGNGQQAVYVSARSYCSESKSYSWSNGVRLESGSEWNELPVLAANGAEGSWLMVGSRCDLNGQAAENTKLFAATVNPAARADIDSVTVDSAPASAVANGRIDVTLHIVNNGLASSDAFSVTSRLLCGDTVVDTKESFWQKAEAVIGESDTADIFPLFSGNGEAVPQSFAIPEGTPLPDCVLEVTIKDGTSQIVSSDTFPLYEGGSFYEISSVSAEQRGDGFLLHATLRNAGAEATDPDDLITTAFRDAYLSGAAEEEFGTLTVGALTRQLTGTARGLALGESIALELPLTVSEEKLNTGYVNGVLDIRNEEGASLAQAAAFMLSLSAPCDLKVNGGQTHIVLREGDTLPLRGSYCGNERFVGGSVRFRAQDNTVAMTDGDMLLAIAPGTTTLDLTVAPFGGSGSVTVEVLEATSDEEPPAHTVVKEEPGCPQDESCPAERFTDIDPRAWYHDGVHFCLENGYMNGVATDKFAPAGTLSRAMIVTMLWRMEGKPVVNYAMSFKDVKAGQWYTEAIRWAAEKIVEGYSDGTFDPMRNITREELATILYRFAGSHAIDAESADPLALFTDRAKISAWALDAMQWANAARLMQGRTATTLAPQESITRAEAATMVQRYCEAFRK